MSDRRERLISMSSSGRFVAIRKDADGQPLIDVADALGTAPRAIFEEPELDDFACLADTLWIAGGGRVVRRRLDEPDEEPLAVDLAIDAPTIELYAVGAKSHELALLTGERRVVVLDAGDHLEPIELAGLAGGTDVCCLPLSPARVAVATDRLVEIRDRQRGTIDSGQLPGRGRVVSGAVLFGGKALCFLTIDDGRAALDVVRPTGTLVHHVDIDVPDSLAFANNRGVALLSAGDELIAVDLRYGSVANRVATPVDALDIAVDSDARYVAIAGRRDDDHLAVLHIPYTELFGGRSRTVTSLVTERLDARSDARSDARESTPADEKTGDDGATETSETPGEWDDEWVEEAGGDDLDPTALYRGPLLALRPRVEVPPRPGGGGAFQAYTHASEHVEDLLDLITARAGLAIAEAWDSGRLSAPNETDHPYQTEVMAILGQRRGGAGDLVTAVRERSEELAARVSGRARATLAAGLAVPLVTIAAQFDLDAVDTRVLTAIAAPSLRGEIARLYGILANDVARPLCDAYLVETLLCEGEGWARTDVKAALHPTSVLRRHGLVRALPAGRQTDLFAPLAVDPVLLGRLHGLEMSVAPGSASVVERATRPLEELSLPPALVHACVESLRVPPRDGRPVRLVIAGRQGSGRTTLIAALAQRVNLPITVIDAERLPRSELVDALRSELQRAALRGTLPVVSGLGFVQSGEEQLEDRMRDVLRSHPGPLAIRTSPEHRPPIDPGYLMFTIPNMTEAERYDFWRSAIERRQLVAEHVDELASRFRVGPGTVESVIDTVVARLDPSERSLDISEQLDRAARQHIDSRLGAVSTQIKRLARWEQIALPDDILDSVREFIGRVRHRRTVYDHWGFDKRVTSARGLSALFYGPPGTGKTLVAGVIARELGLDLYRVDLARITSKWIGETEKNLAEIFDAAEDGQAIILFDEADSLFAKRTEVKSSVDRYANLEVNYLLQRFDTFEGVAILTTNIEGSIDQAFKRRLSLRLAFPFPDEEMRVRLWAAHIPPEVPNAGDFDFEHLAKRYPMSGGYIRNSALRAAFLAAQENAALSQQHLERVIELEYQEMGKLSKTGKMA